jgi:hypothetical protein
MARPICRASIHIRRHGVFICEDPAAGAVIDLWDVAPYDVPMCAEHKQRYTGHRFVPYNNSGEREPSLAFTIGDPQP